MEQTGGRRGPQEAEALGRLTQGGLPRLPLSTWKGRSIPLSKPKLNLQVFHERTELFCEIGEARDACGNRCSELHFGPSLSFSFSSASMFALSLSEG